MSALRSIPQHDELVFGWEKIASLLNSDNETLARLFFEHWEEMGVHKDVMPLKPDWHRLLMLNDSGQVHVWTARDEMMELVGYAVWYLTPHLDHSETPTAEMGPYFLSRDHRKGLAGVRMLSSSIARLREAGIKRVIGHSRLGQLDVIFRRLKFAPLDQTWDRML